MTVLSAQTQQEIKTEGSAAEQLIIDLLNTGTLTLGAVAEYNYKGIIDILTIAGFQIEVKSARRYIKRKDTKKGYRDGYYTIKKDQMGADFFIFVEKQNTPELLNKYTETDIYLTDPSQFKGRFGENGVCKVSVPEIRKIARCFQQ